MALFTSGGTQLNGRTGPKRRPRFRAVLESLEGRQLLTSGISYLPNGALQVEGTNRNDSITLKAARSSAGLVMENSVMITMNSKTSGPWDTHGLSVIVHGNAGDDTIAVDPSFTGPNELYGDTGNDTFTAGQGTTLINGGPDGGSDINYANLLSYDSLATPSKPAALVAHTPRVKPAAGTRTTPIIINTTGVIIHGQPGNNTILIEWYTNSPEGDAVLHPPYPHHVDFLKFDVNGVITEMQYDPKENKQATIIVYGGSGQNNVQMTNQGAGQHWNAVFRGGTGKNTLVASDKLFGHEFGPEARTSELYGGRGENTLIGGTGTVLIQGGSGTNTIRAGAGAATIYGGPGLNTIYGGAAMNSITCGTGKTTIIGGSGNMVIHHFTALSTIKPGTGSYVVNWSPLPASGHGVGIDAFVAMVYSEEFGRVATQAELRHWSCCLAHGYSPSNMVSQLAKTGEHQVLLAAGRVSSLSNAVVLNDALAAAQRARLHAANPDAPVGVIS